MAVTTGEIDTLMLGVCAERLRALGREPSGLWNYYAGRVERGSMLVPVNVLVSDWLIANTTGPIVDIGAGIGQLAVLIAARSDRDVYAIEHHPGRYETLASVVTALRYWRPDARLTPIHGPFPAAMPDLPDAIGVFGGFTSHFTETQREAIWAKVGMLRGVAFEGRTFMSRPPSFENDTAAKAANAHMLMSMGFSEPVAFVTSGRHDWMWSSV